MTPSCSGKCAASCNPMGRLLPPSSSPPPLLALLVCLLLLLVLPAAAIDSTLIESTSLSSATHDVTTSSSLSSSTTTSTTTSSSTPPPKQTLPSTSIIDILSGSAEFSILISHLQRLDLIALINQARNITLLAPSNDAFLDVEPHAVTRDRLLFHIINATFIVNDFLEDTILLSNIHPSFLHSINYILPQPLANDNPAASLPLDHPSIPVFFSKVESDHLGETVTDIVAEAGVDSVSVLVETDLKASRDRGVVQVVNKLLDPPPSTCSILQADPKFSIFFSLFILENDCSGPVFGGPSTLLVPSDAAFLEQLSKTEILYLTSDWGKADRQALLARHTIDTGFIASPLIPKFAKQHQETAIIKASDGCHLNISTSMTVNGTVAPTRANIVANDGILHYYDKFMSGPDGNLHSLISFTPEKHLLVLGAETFVKEVKFRSLRYLINGSSPEDHQTIFAPRDDSDNSLLSKRSFVSSHPKNEQGDEIYSFGTAYTQSVPTVLYHFVEGQHTLDIEEIVNSNYLLVSKASFKRLGYGIQRIKVSANEAENEIYLNGHDLVTDGPYVVGNTTIYLIDGSLDPPPPMDLAVGSVLQSAQSATYFQQLGFFNLPSSNGWTILLPTAIAWKSVGLVTHYLETNLTALRIILESHILRVPFYSDSDTIKTKLFDGTEVTVSSHAIASNDISTEDQVAIEKKKKKHKKNHKKNGSGGNDDDGGNDDIGNYAPLDLYIGKNHYHVETADVLSTSGVIHAVNEVVIPDQIDVTQTNILESIDASLFIALLEARNMSHVLNSDAEYTILTPSNKVLQANNITVNTPDIDILLRLHVLPSNPIGYFLDGGDVESLETDVHLTAKEIDSGLYLVSIVESDSLHEIRVLDRGDTTPYSCPTRSGHSNNCKSTILYVDRYLSPDWIARPVPPFSPPFHLRTPFAILLGVVFGAILIFSIMSVALLFFLGRSRSASQQKSYASSVNGAEGASGGSGGGLAGLLSGQGSPDSPDKRPLLSRKSSAVSSNSASGSGPRRHRGRHSATHSVSHSSNNSPPENAAGQNGGTVDDHLAGPPTNSGFYGSLDTSGMMLPTDDYANFKNAANNNNNNHNGTTKSNASNSTNHARRSSTFSTRSASSMTSEHSVSEPIPTGKVSGAREHGKHLNLPRAC